MTNPDAVVSNVLRFEPPLERPPDEMLQRKAGLRVELEEGRIGRLDPADPRSAGFARILDGLIGQRRPVYVEIDPETSVITRLLIPHVTQVVEVREIEEGLGVELARSHARHVLRRDADDFAEIERRLREAVDGGGTLIVTEDDAHNIVDVRFFEPGPEGPPIEKPEVPPPRNSFKDLVDWISGWLSQWLRCASPTKAQQVFDVMSADTCDPLTVPAPCIPFLYPDDGCFARAHEMCRLMIDMGLEPGKVWIKGDLHVDTKNKPDCEVFWGWHVAPTLCVRGPGVFQTQDMVIDPSLFTTPVTKAEWKLKQGDPNAAMIDSDPSPYFHTFVWASNGTDPNYVDTNIDLAYYRLQLLNRSIQHGPPPYANCP